MQSHSYNKSTMKTLATATTPATPPLAVTLWTGDMDAELRKIVSSGASVSKAMMKAAPKGLVLELRGERREHLSKNTASLLGGFTDRGFTIVSATPIKTLKNGVEQVTLRLATPKPTSAMTIAEFAKSAGKTVAEILAAVEMK